MKNQINTLAPLLGLILLGSASLFGAPPAPSAHEVVVCQTLDELKQIYAQTGTLNWDQAKALLAQREKAAQGLADRLAALGPRGARALASGYAQVDSPRAKLLVVRGLGKIGDVEAVGVLQDVLARDSSLSIQKEVVRALSQREEPAAEQALTGILAHEDPQLRFTAAQALSKRKSAGRVLAERLKRESSPLVRRELIRSLGLIGDQTAMNALADVAQSPTDLELRKTAVHELGRSYGGSARGILERLSSDPDEEIRKAAGKALGRVK